METNCRYCHKGHSLMIEMEKEELVYDIKNTAFAFADSLPTADTDPKTLHNIYDVGEEGNRDKLARILDSTVEDCREMLFRYTKVEMQGGGFESNDWEECVGAPMNDEEAYYMEMQMPQGFSKTSVHTMAVYIHDYIVNQALYEWMMIVYQTGADRFWALAEEKRQKIKDASNRSAGRCRLKLHPF